MCGFITHLEGFYSDPTHLPETLMIRLQNYIAGQWEAVPQQLDVPLCNASTGEAIGRQVESGTEQLERALALAAQSYDAKDGWCSLSATERAACLLKAADALEARAAQIAELDSLFTGVIISLTGRLARICGAAFRGAAGLLQDDGGAGANEKLLIERTALGPAAIIGPWNAPAGIMAHKLASALAAGCPALVKPSEWAPHSVQVIAEALQEAGLPADACQLLHGSAETGSALVSDERVAAVSFTGGLAGGRAVARACAAQVRPAQLELGGNNPLLALEDADVENAADGAVTAMTTLNGQWCRALGRLLVHKHLEAELLERIKQKLARLSLGDALDPDSAMGPLAHRRHRQLIERQVAALRDKGGVIHQCTPLPALGGWFYPPTVITGLRPDDTVEEIFGPVACLHSFEDDEQAVRLANQTPYGLAAYVFGDEGHCWQVARKIRAGVTKINAVTLLNLSPEAPRPAWGLSGLGDEGTRETFEFFRGTRVIGVAGP